MIVDASDLTKQFDRGEDVYIGFQYITSDIENGINALLGKILSRIDMAYLYDTMESILRELVQNAVKANMKRICFEDLHLDICDEDDYLKGMRKFKDVVYHPEMLREKMLASTYRITVKFRKTVDGIEIDIVNNARIVPIELERLRDRAHKAAECSNFAEAYENMYDATEGAGLGIVLSVMLLKNAGISPEHFKIVAGVDTLRITIVIPRQLKSPEITSKIGNRIIEDVKSLPTFPENILELRVLCNNPETTIEAISEKISLDPALAADVLKLSNSAGFITGKRINKIQEAVMVIGLKNIESLLIASASRKIIDRRYRKFEQVWEHCNRTAYFARQIALDKGYAPIADTVFIAGLLHDIGKIVLLSTEMKLIEEISDIVRNRKIRTSAIIEEVYIGISHSAIGAQVAEHWCFPEDLVESIRYHHAPLGPDIRNRDMVMIVHLADRMCSMESDDIDLVFFETEVLEKFGLQTRPVFEKFYKRLLNRYYMQEKFF